MLTEIQERLDRHFTALRCERVPVGLPVYALEHGVGVEEIEPLIAALAAELSSRRELRQDHWLVWVVAATEIGYAYDGDEYWSTFGRAIPCWRQYGNRETIRGWFRRFAERYAGFRPSGRWADHFSIIAWPIAHAILPRDLQGQFAHQLYDLSHKLAQSINGSPLQIGHILESGDHEGSSRFRNLLEQKDLTGRLVLALRDQSAEGALVAILPSTLARIVNDLEEAHSARAWLRGARRVLQEARLKGVGQLVGKPATVTGIATVPSSRSPNEGVRFVAKRSADGQWIVGLAFPNVTALITSSGLPKEILAEADIRLGDRSDTWMPGEALRSLHLTDQRVLSLSEVIAGPVIRLRNSIPALAAFVLSKLAIVGRSPWLLRVQQDGIARQVLGNHVRSKQNYLLLSAAALSQDLILALNLSAEISRTDTAFIYSFETPATLGPGYLHALSQLEVGYSIRATVDAVGLVPRVSGSSDGAEWTTTEQPLLRLSADFDIEDFTIAVDGSDETRVPVARGKEAFVCLGHLPIGTHIVEVGGSLKRAERGQSSQIVETERFPVTIRAPVPWRQTVGRHAGFRVSLAPTNATLDGLLAGKAKISIIGPADRRALVEMRTFDVNGHLRNRDELGRVSLPVAETTIHRLIAKLGKAPLIDKVQGSVRVDLAFQIEELGVASLSFSQRVEALRWKLELRHGTSFFRLIDEAGGDHQVAIDRFDILSPDKSVSLSLQECLDGIPLEPPGALLDAKLNNRSYRAVITPVRTMTSLAELGVVPSFLRSFNDPKHIPRLISLHRLWNRARPIGPLAPLHRAMVVQALEQQIAGIVCGTHWANRAQRCLAGQRDLFEQLQHDVWQSRGFGARIRSYGWKGVGDPSMGPEFAALAETYRVTGDRDLCDLALRLAFAPDDIKFADPNEGVGLLVRLTENPAIAKGAFLAKLAHDIAIQEFLRASESA